MYYIFVYNIAIELRVAFAVQRDPLCSVAQRDPARSKQHAREKALTRYAIRKNGTAVCGAMAQGEGRASRGSGRDSRGRDGTSACRRSLSSVESRANQTWRFGRCLRCEHTVTSAGAGGISTRE